MKCQMCKKNEAVILIHQVINNKKKVIKLCEDCALDSGFIEEKDDEVEFNLSNFIFSGLTLTDKDRESRLKETCKVCGTSLLTILKEKRCGCSECYSTFRYELKRRLKKCLGLTCHKGKYPRRLKAYKTFLFDLRALKDKLTIAVHDEDYESAAELRDEIKLLKNSDW
ncbi:MAG: UvrB/UvrC motif-containing protein [Spirochaetales bacterium]|nr:UvrB/UvrC motif-containing protein [Spirochaetales bacterium]